MDWLLNSFKSNSLGDSFFAFALIIFIFLISYCLFLSKSKKRSGAFKTVLFVILGGLVGWLIHSLTAPLSDEVIQSCKAKSEAIARWEVEQAESLADFDRQVVAHESYLKSIEEVANLRAQILKVRETIETSKSTQATEVSQLLKKNRASDEKWLKSQCSLYELQTLKTLQTASLRLKEIVAYKTDAQNIWAQAKEAMTQIESDKIEATVKEAQNSYPESRESIQKIYNSLLSQLAIAKAAEKKLATLIAATQVDFYAAGLAADALLREVKKWSESLANVENDLKTLSFSEDRVLIDISQNGAYFHRYRIIRNGQVSDSDWVSVPFEYYFEHQGDLGMVLYSKPLGVLASQASKVASPPGYSYVGNSRFGSWKGENWVFNEQYASLQAQLSGGSSFVQPITLVSWNLYNNLKSQGKSYYGSSGDSRIYGSSGSHSKKAYASSSYYKTQAKKSSGRARYGSGTYGASSYGLGHSPSDASKARAGYNQKSYEKSRDSKKSYSGSSYKSSSSRGGGYRGSGYRSSSSRSGGYRSSGYRSSPRIRR